MAAEYCGYNGNIRILLAFDSCNFLSPDLIEGFPYLIDNSILMGPLIFSVSIFSNSKTCFFDSLACAFLALEHKKVRDFCNIAYISDSSGSVGVIGTDIKTNPVDATFLNGALIRWLDFNDTWLAEEWGHPSDNLGAILPLTDFLSLKKIRKGQEPIKVSELLEHTIKAHEIQGVLALDNSFNKVGLDHVLLVRVA